MSGITEIAERTTALLDQCASILESKASSDPSLQTVVDSIKSASTSITSQAAATSDTIGSLFTGIQAQITLGYVRFLHSACDGAATNLTQDFLSDLGDLFKGIGLEDKMVPPAQSLLDFINQSSDPKPDEISSKVSSLLSQSTSALNQLTDASSSASTIISIGKTVMEYVGLMSSVMGTFPSGSKSDTWGDNQKDLICTDAMRSMAVDLALSYPVEQTEKAVCQFIISSGYLDKVIEAQNTLNERTNALRG